MLSESLRNIIAHFLGDERSQGYPCCVYEFGGNIWAQVRNICISLPVMCRNLSYWKVPKSRQYDGKAEIYLKIETENRFHLFYTYLPTPLLGQDMTQSQLLKELDKFEFSVFLLLDEYPHQGKRNQSTLRFTHSLRENTWIHTFPKGISAMWNTISLAQD